MLLTSKFSRRHPKIVTNFKSPTSWFHQHPDVINITVVTSLSGSEGLSDWLWWYQLGPRAARVEPTIFFFEKFGWKILVNSAYLKFVIGNNATMFDKLLIRMCTFGVIWLTNWNSKLENKYKKNKGGESCRVSLFSAFSISNRRYHKREMFQ